MVQPSIFRFSFVYNYLVLRLPPDANAFIGLPAFNIVKILISYNSLVGIVQTHENLVKSSVEHNVNNGAIQARLRMVGVFFIFEAKVKFFRTYNTGCAFFKLKEITFADEFSNVV